MDGSAFLWYIEVKDTAKKRRKWNMGQKEIEALIAAGGAPCEICGGRMAAHGLGYIPEASIISGSSMAVRTLRGLMSGAMTAVRSWDTTITPTAMWSSARYAAGS